MPMVKKKSKKAASRLALSACYEEAPPPPTFEDAPWPEPCEDAPCPDPCEEVTRRPYDQDCPAPCDEEPPPEPVEQEVDYEASERGLTPAQERSTQPSDPDITEDEQAWISPYTKTPVSIQFGAEETAYLVPPHFLPAEWLESGVRERLGFPGIDAHTGHTIVHYLYKGSYETPRTSNSVPRSKNSGLRAALWVFIATSNHGLYDLQQLATQEIEKHGSSLSLTKLLETIDDTFAFLDPHSWVHEYLRRKARVAFEQDHTVFSDTAFLQSLGNLALIKFMARCVVDLYSTKIARMMDREQSVGQSETPKDREERHRSQIGDSPNIMQTTSRFSSVASEISVEQSCEPRIEAATLSDSFSTLSCSLPEAPPYETDPCPEATAEDDQEISEQMAVSASAEVCEAVDEPWPAAEQLKDAEPEAISEWPRLVGKVADESLTMTQEWSAIPSEVQCEDIPEAIIESEEEEYISPCHSQAQHVLMGTGWKSCAHCFDVVRRLAGQIS